jgi:glycosyltransferase involved in cell wall biosynthesis
VRVLFHLLDSGIGGGQLVASRVAVHLAERGDEVGLVVPDDGPAAERFRELGAQVTVIDATTLRDPLAARRLGRFLGEYDVLYSHTATPGAILGAVAARLAKRPHVVHQHTFPYFSPSQPAQTAQRALLRNVTRKSRFIAVADHVRTGLETAGIAPDRIVVIPNAAPPVALPAGPAGSPVTVGMLGRLDPGKNLHVFLDAATRAAPKAPVRYLVAGASSPFAEYERDVRAQAAAAGIEIVRADDGQAFLNSLDVVVIPSSFEGSPLVLFEAMAAGRAVIASDIPGIREVLEPEGAGVLIAPVDAVALARAIEELVDNDQRRAELGRRALEVVTTRYSLAAMLDQAVAVLDEAVS